MLFDSHVLTQVIIPCTCNWNMISLFPYYNDILYAFLYLYLIHILYSQCIFVSSFHLKVTVSSRLALTETFPRPTQNNIHSASGGDCNMFQNTQWFTHSQTWQPLTLGCNLDIFSHVYHGQWDGPTDHYSQCIFVSSFHLKVTVSSRLALTETFPRPLQKNIHSASGDCNIFQNTQWFIPVSYTHLTLPTKA